MSIQIPPGASYRAPKAMIIARRHLRHLEDPVRIEFKQEWKEGNPLFDWYQRRTSKFIDKIELRREREAPFHHEFVVFRLGKEGGYFRIDRRQNSPLDFLHQKGVEANDTVEEVSSMNDHLYSASDCLVSLDLRIGVHLSIILQTCWAIQMHPSAWAYTPQCYNSYFLAQTILMCAARSVPDEGTFDRIRDMFRFSYDWDNVFTRFREHDKDLHVWGIMHEEYCYSHTCHSDIAPPPYACDDCIENVPDSPKTTFKSCAQPRLPIWATTLLFNFKRALTKFWQDAFLSLVGIALPEPDWAMKTLWADGKGNKQDRLEQLFDSGAYSRRVSWGKMCFEHLQPLAKKIEPMMRQALRCPVMPVAPAQCTEIDPNQIVKKWAGVMLQFFDNEFERLNSSLKDQVLKIWRNHLELDECPITEDVIEGRQLPSMQIQIVDNSYSLHRVVTISQLAEYHEELIEKHAHRVASFNFGVFEEVRSDITIANDDIWMSVKTDKDCSYCYGLHDSEFSPSVKSEEGAKTEIGNAPIWCALVEQRLLEARTLLMYGP
ncbi:unnamed protein product [Rhizoctonia solani]|uniref:Uncharacterized protein n=1 Tax=Rhizoctonia solani TaxID=456999 RepID=A0A8H3C4B8_9AGAM|nr:unnamed protein product [Rhizoctonia solani]